RRSGVRRAARLWRASVRGAELYAAEAGGARHPPELLVPPGGVAAQELCALGRTDRRVRAPPRRALWHRGGEPLVLRGVERAQSRLLGRPAAPVDLLGAVRPHRQGTQGG